MKILKFKDEQEWLDARRGKITGSKLKDIVIQKGKKEKVGFYELIADRLGLPPGDENAMERGHELEPEAIERFEESTGKKVNTDLVIWEHAKYPNIALSPDGFIGKTEAVEVKCLSSARHIQAVIENEVPAEYKYQVIQYFIVNEKLKTLYFVFYDPRLKIKDFHVITINRTSLQDEIEEITLYQIAKLEKINAIVAELTQF
uniref:Putative exonuclease n=1 Tax=viral metagenome TaxID=1070528 RepID=A0A6H1ZB00_9ZZZZ